MKNLASVRQPVRPNPMRYRATPFASRGGASLLPPQGPIHPALLSRESVFPSTQLFPFSSRPMPTTTLTATTYSVSPELLLLIGGIVPDWATKLIRDNPDDAAYMMLTLAALAVLSFVAAWKADSRYKEIQHLNKELERDAEQMRQLRAALQNHVDQIEGLTAMQRIGEEALAFLSPEERNQLVAIAPPEALLARSLRLLRDLLTSSPREAAPYVIKVRERLAEKLASPRETLLVKAMQEIIRKMNSEEREELAAALYELAEDPEALLGMFFSDAWQATVRSFPQRISEGVLPRTLLIKTARSKLQDVREATARITKNDEKEPLLILATDPLPTLAEGAFRRVASLLTEEDLTRIMPGIHNRDLLWKLASHPHASPMTVADIFNQLIQRHEVVIQEAITQGSHYGSLQDSYTGGEVSTTFTQPGISEHRFRDEELRRSAQLLATRPTEYRGSVLSRLNQLNKDLATAIESLTRGT